LQQQLQRLSNGLIQFRAMSSAMRQKIIRPAPSEISFKDMRFLITDRPTDQTIANFIEVISPVVKFAYAWPMVDLARIEIV
jgi:hypothetical protein